MTQLYFEDAEIGMTSKAGPYLVSKEEIVQFAKQYDPAPRHLDEEAAARSIFGGLTASSAHTFSIFISLTPKLQPRLHVLAGMGWDELRLPNPVRPGDELDLELIVLEKREQSRNLTGASFDSKFDCAIKETKSTFLLRVDRTFVRIDRGPRATGSLWVLAPSIDCRLVRLTPVMGLHRRIDVRSSPISLWQKKNPPEGGFFASSRSTIGIDRDEPLLPYRKSEMRQG